MWSAEKWSFLLHLKNLVNSSSVTSDRHQISEEFVPPVILCRGGLELIYGILHSHLSYTPSFCFYIVSLETQPWNQVPLWICFPMISVWISGLSPIKVCLFIITNANTTIQGHLVIKPMGLCYKAYGLWGHLVYRNKQDPFQSTMPDNAEVNFSHLLFSLIYSLGAKSWLLSQQSWWK